VSFVFYSSEWLTILPPGAVSLSSTLPDMSNYVADNWRAHSSYTFTVLLPGVFQALHYQYMVALFSANWTKPVLTGSRITEIQLWSPFFDDYRLITTNQLTSRWFQYVSVSPYQFDQSSLLGFTFSNWSISNFNYTGSGSSRDVVPVKIETVYSENFLIGSFVDVLMPRILLADLIGAVVLPQGIAHS